MDKNTTNIVSFDIKLDADYLYNLIPKWRIFRRRKYRKWQKECKEIEKDPVFQDMIRKIDNFLVGNINEKDDNLDEKDDNLWENL